MLPTLTVRARREDEPQPENASHDDQEDHQGDSQCQGRQVHDLMQAHHARKARARQPARHRRAPDIDPQRDQRDAHIAQRPGFTVHEKPPHLPR